MTSCIFSPWRWSSALCYKASSCWFIHHFRILLKHGTMRDVIVFPWSAADSFWQPQQQESCQTNWVENECCANECCALRVMCVDGVSLVSSISYFSNHIYVSAARVSYCQNHIDAQGLAPCESVFATIVCAHWSKITCSTVSAWSSVMCDYCLNGDTHSTHKVGHLEVATHIIHPATLLPALFLIEYQLCACHTFSQQCSGMSHARQLVAAETMTDAEEFCQCALCLTQASLRKVQYKCENS